MAALNIVGESLTSSEKLSLLDENLDKRIDALNESLEAALIKHTQLEF